jgi:O-antigen biosynthesis protein WbqV
MNQEDFLPFSVLIINTFVLTLILLIPRFIARIMHTNKTKKIKRKEAENRQKGRLINERCRILLIGGADSARSFLEEMSTADDVSYEMEPVGIVTLDQSEVGHTIKGVQIVGTIRQIDGIIKELALSEVSLQQIVITEKDLSPKIKQFLTECCRKHCVLLVQAFHQYTFCNLDA